MRGTDPSASQRCSCTVSARWRQTDLPPALAADTGADDAQGLALAEEPASAVTVTIPY